MSTTNTPPEEKSRKGWFSRLFRGDEKPVEATDAEHVNVAVRPDDAAPETLVDDAASVVPEDVVPEDAVLVEETVISVPEPEPEPESESEPEVEELAAEEEDTAPLTDAVVAEELAAEETPSVAPVTPPASVQEAEPTKKGWLARLKEGLGRSSSRLGRGITDLFTKRRLDDEALEDLEDLLITADLGVETARRVTQRLSKARFGQEVTPEEIRTALAEEVTEILTPVAQPLTPDSACKPFVVLVVGVNGSGKTTTIGKMAKYYSDQGLQVSLAAGDTFRAAAVEQLKVWGERTGCPVISRDQGADAAGLAFDALHEAKERGDDLLLIDTAGRLQNKKDLMAELQKIVRVLQKKDPTAPHATLLVLDATVGQNAHSQVENFKEITNVSGLILTKLDGTARGGVLVALAERFGLPVHAIGIGEAVDDLRPFDPLAFARGLTGLD